MYEIKLLIVDDDERLLDGLRRVLTRIRPDWYVAIASGTDVAMEHLKRSQFDAMVTDIDMPGKDGTTLLNASTQFSDLLRVAMSGRYGALEIYSKTACSHRFIGKPFHGGDLVRLIESAIAVRRLEERRAKIWLDHAARNPGNVPAFESSREQQRRINRERLRQIGVQLPD